MKILAVDYGDSRTGLATCDRTEFLTTAITPQITLKARNKVAARVCEVAKEIEAEMILIGLPLNMDGTEGERAAKSRKLAKTVELWSGLPVRMWDERQTTCAAADLLDESGTYGSRRKEILDSVSATVILEDYLAWRKEHPGAFSVANTIARKLNPILAGSRLARYPVMAPLCSSARTRRWHGERLRFTRSASSVSDRRPSDCSSARIFLSMLSMWKIFSFSPCYEHNIESLFLSVSDILFRNV